MDENSQLREELSRLRDEVARLETASQEHQRKSRDQVNTTSCISGDFLRILPFLYYTFIFMFLWASFIELSTSLTSFKDDLI